MESFGLRNRRVMVPYPTQWAGYDPQKFMCRICFAVLDVEDAAVDKDDERIDVCVACWLAEREATSG